MGRLGAADYVKARPDDEAFACTRDDFDCASGPLIAAGAEALIPAGGLPAFVLALRAGLGLEGAIVLNGVRF